MEKRTRSCQKNKNFTNLFLYDNNLFHKYHYHLHCQCTLFRNCVIQQLKLLQLNYVISHTVTDVIRTSGLGSFRPNVIINNFFLTLYTPYSPNLSFNCAYVTTVIATYVVTYVVTFT